MAQLKIKVKRIEPYPLPFIDRHGKVRRGNLCRTCGKPLRDEKSIERGYGPECWKALPIMVILEIPGSES